MYFIFQIHEKLSDNLSPMARPNVLVLIQTSEEMFLPTNLRHKFMKFVNNMVNVYNLKVSHYIALSKLTREFVKVRIKIYYSRNSIYIHVTE